MKRILICCVAALLATLTCYASGTAERMDGMCGSPITDHTRIECGIVLSADPVTNEVVLLDDTGNEWVVEVGYADQFDLNGYYCIFFDTMDTETIEDDHIVKLFVERW